MATATAQELCPPLPQGQYVTFRYEGDQCASCGQEFLLRADLVDHKHRTGHRMVRAEGRCPKRVVSA